MPVIGSSYVLSPQTPDGRVYVTETHTITGGRIETMEYGPVPAGHDFDATIAARVVLLNEELERQEFEEMVRGT